MTSLLQNKTLTLKKNFLWTLSGNLVYGFLQWLILIMLARLGSPDLVGQFMIGLTLTAPIIMFLNLGLRQIQATDVQRNYQFSDYLGLRLIAVGLALVIIFSMVFIADYSNETRLIILIMAVAKGFESISDVFYGLFQQRARMDYIAKSLVLGGFGSLTVMAILMFITRNLTIVVIGMLVVWLLQLLMYDIRQARHVETNLMPSFQLDRLKLLVILALPLGFVALLNSLNTNIPRYFVESYWGEYQLGIFGTLSYLIIIGNRFVTAIGEVIAPRIAQYIVNDDRRMLRLFLLRSVGYGVVLGAGSIGGAWLLGYEVLNLIYGIEYATHHQLFIVLMIVAAVGYQSLLLHYFMVAHRLFREQLLLTMLATGSLLIASYLLIPAHGNYGAAVAMGMSVTLQFVISLGIIIWKQR